MTALYLTQDGRAIVQPDLRERSFADVDQLDPIAEAKAAVLSAVRVWHAERLRWVGRSHADIGRAATRIDQLIEQLESVERSQRGWVAAGD